MRTTVKPVVFISHASEDSEKAEEICGALEGRGLTCWIAPRDVRAGREYADEIIRGIEQSGAVVLVLSDEANSSAFVRREIERAVSKHKPVFPVRIEHVSPSPGLELFVSSTQWIDAWTGRWENHMDRLARAVATPGTDMSSWRSRAGHRTFKTVYAVVGLVLLVGLGALAFPSFWRQASPSQADAPRPVENGPVTPEPSGSPVTDTVDPPPTRAQETTRQRDVEPRGQSATQAAAPAPRSTATPAPTVVEDTRELNELREVYDELSLRGGVVDDTLNQLWESMKPLSPRLDMVTHQRSLGTSLTRGKDALDAKDAAAARRYLEVARTDLQVLEQFLNR